MARSVYAELECPTVWFCAAVAKETLVFRYKVRHNLQSLVAYRFPDLELIRLVVATLMSMSSSNRG